MNTINIAIAYNTSTWQGTISASIIYKQHKDADVDVKLIPLTPGDTDLVTSDYDKIFLIDLLDLSTELFDEPNIVHMNDFNILGLDRKGVDIDKSLVRSVYKYSNPGKDIPVWVYYLEYVDNKDYANPLYRDAVIYWTGVRFILGGVFNRKRLEEANNLFVRDLSITPLEEYEFLSNIGKRFSIPVTHRHMDDGTGVYDGSYKGIMIHSDNEIDSIELSLLMLVHPTIKYIVVDSYNGDENNVEIAIVITDYGVKDGITISDLGIKFKSQKVMMDTIAIVTTDVQTLNNCMKAYSQYMDENDD